MSPDEFYPAFSAWVTKRDDTSLRSYLDSADSPERLKVYRNTYVTGALDVLERRFPSVVNAVERQPFRRFALGYVDRFCPTERSLTEYGKNFPAYLSEQSTPLKKARLSYLPDLALLDLAWSAVYFAEDVAPLGQEDMSLISAKIDTIELQLCQSVQLVRTEWSVTKLWAILRDKKASKKIKVKRNKQNTLVFRTAEGAVRFNILSKAEAEFISAIERGYYLPVAAEQADKIGAIDFAEFLANLLTNGILKLRE